MGSSQSAALEELGINPEVRISSVLVDKIWRAVDKENVGQLNKKQSLQFLKGLCKKTKVPAHTDRLEKLFALCDEDHNGYLVRSEFNTMIIKWAKHHKMEISGSLLVPRKPAEKDEKPKTDDKAKAEPKKGPAPSGAPPPIESDEDIEISDEDKETKVTAPPAEPAPITKSEPKKEEGTSDDEEDEVESTFRTDLRF
eukprot:TRINITY_DN2191_c0_g1_i4.p1 TRINITY_DN2191_c0_g1~~TRINITY_DN2191_c0_g1_i4.p1  ORF type:complete len:197 (+),score=31.88 TRINITY_DN2191_c0_g1_i4:26-616(+)